MRVPVGIYENSVDSHWGRSYEPNDDNTKDKTPEVGEIVYNEYLSGIYYVLGNRYIYEKDMGFKTELTLTKRDWIPNPAK